jgi:uncharacterized RDD family membrane protein YckC
MIKSYLCCNQKPTESILETGVQFGADGPVLMLLRHWTPYQNSTITVTLPVFSGYRLLWPSAYGATPGKQIMNLTILNGADVIGYGITAVHDMLDLRFWTQLLALTDLWH